MEKFRMESEVQRVMDRYGCDQEDAVKYLDLREEGYSQYQATVMAGIHDPDY